MSRYDWELRGLCREVDPEIFFPEQGESNKDAKRICARCDVREQCLAAALEREEPFGVWGGLNTRQRRRLLKGAA
jgi:hypothetical protein